MFCYSKKHLEISNFQKRHKFIILNIQIECITYNLNSKLCLKAYLIQFNFRPKLLGYLILENPKMLLRILEFTAKLLNIYSPLCSQIWLAKEVPTIYEYNSFFQKCFQTINFERSPKTSKKIRLSSLPTPKWQKTLTLAGFYTQPIYFFGLEYT